MGTPESLLSSLGIGAPQRPGPPHEPTGPLGLPGGPRSAATQRPGPQQADPQQAAKQRVGLLLRLTQQFGYPAVRNELIGGHPRGRGQGPRTRNFFAEGAPLEAQDTMRVSMESPVVPGQGMPADAGNPSAIHKMLWSMPPFQMEAVDQAFIQFMDRQGQAPGTPAPAMGPSGPTGPPNPLQGMRPGR